MKLRKEADAPKKDSPHRAAIRDSRWSGIFIGVFIGVFGCLGLGILMLYVDSRNDAPGEVYEAYSADFGGTVEVRAEGSYDIAHYRGCVWEAAEDTRSVSGTGYACAERWLNPYGLSRYYPHDRFEGHDLVLNACVFVETREGTCECRPYWYRVIP